MRSAQRLTTAFTHLGEALPLAQYPLPIDGAEVLRSLTGAMAQQVRDYLLPRASRLDAPLLAVVGGSTGAGKSTLVNSLLRAQVTRPGILRPTTKSPVLVCHPNDEAWFRDDHVLPGLVRTEAQLHDSRALHIVATDALPPGLALLDAPDIDSIDDANRHLARQLLAAADLWVFVTSAARYADAVPWEYLATAAERNTVISVIVNRCPPGAVSDIVGHLSQLLAERGLPQARLYGIAERALPSDCMLPAGDVSGIRQWLDQLAKQADARALVAIQSLAGSVRSLDAQLQELAAGVSRQHEALAQLRRDTVAPYQRAAAEVDAAAGDGSLLRGEILSRWQDLVGTGDFMRSVEERIGAFRDRIAGWFTGDHKVEAMEVAIADSLTAVLREAGELAAEQTAGAWAASRWGRDIIAAAPQLQRASDEFPERVAATIRGWQSDVIALVDEQGRGKRMKARFLAIGTNLVGVALIIVVFASTGGLTTAEVGIAGGTSLLAQRLLEAVFGEDAVRRLAAKATWHLHDRVDAVLADEASRFTDILDTLAVDQAAVPTLLATAEELREAARAAFDDLTAPELS